METLSKKETIIQEDKEADKAEAYARTQRWQYWRRFGRVVPYIIKIIQYIVIAWVLLAIFGWGYIMWWLQKECQKCWIKILPCEIPKTGATI